MISAKVICDSISSVSGVRLTTMELCYPKYIHGELMTHRVFSRNARSSRAVPVEKILREVATDPVLPIEWGSNRRGMQAGEVLAPGDAELVEELWRALARETAERCSRLAAHGLHKQWANRPLEPFSNIYVVVTSCFWRNFYQLRRHPDAQPEMKALADAMHMAHVASAPKELRPGEWHLPYVTDEDRSALGVDVGERRAQRVSVARCARVSYRTFEGARPTLDEDLALYARLLGSQPVHASPAEHQATPDAMAGPGDCRSFSHRHLWGNFDSWVQYRKTLQGEHGRGYDCGIPGVL